MPARDKNDPDAGSKLGFSRSRTCCSAPGLIRMDGNLTGFEWLAPVNYHPDNQGRRHASAAGPEKEGSGSAWGVDRSLVLSFGYL